MLRYGQKIDTVDAENTTVEDFLQKENFIYEMEIDTYMQVWNKVQFCFGKNKSDTNTSYHSHDCCSPKVTLCPIYFWKTEPQFATR